jgi:hypothetical protein
MKNQQLRELLLRIPPSKETDELQDLLTNMEKELEAQKLWNLQLRNQIKELADKIV